MSVAVLAAARAQDHNESREDFVAPTVFRAAGPTPASIRSTGHRHDGWLPLRRAPGDRV